MTPGKAVLFTVVLLALIGAAALVRRFKRTQDAFGLDFDWLASDEPCGLCPPEAERPLFVVLPETLTCFRCEKEPALPGRLWCAVCAPIVDEFPAEPIERGAK